MVGFEYFVIGMLLGIRGQMDSDQGRHGWAIIFNVLSIAAFSALMVEFWLGGFA